MLTLLILLLTAQLSPATFDATLQCLATSAAYQMDADACIGRAIVADGKIDSDAWGCLNSVETFEDGSTAIMLDCYSHDGTAVFTVASGYDWDGGVWGYGHRVIFED